MADGLLRRPGLGPDAPKKPVSPWAKVAEQKAAAAAGHAAPPATGHGSPSGLPTPLSGATAVPSPLWHESATAASSGLAGGLASGLGSTRSSTVVGASPDTPRTLSLLSPVASLAGPSPGASLSATTITAGSPSAASAPATAAGALGRSAAAFGAPPLAAPPLAPPPAVAKPPSPLTVSTAGFNHPALSPPALATLAVPAVPAVPAGGLPPPPPKPEIPAGSVKARLTALNTQAGGLGPPVSPNAATAVPSSASPTVRGAMPFGALAPDAAAAAGAAVAAAAPAPAAHLPGAIGPGVGHGLARARGYTVGDMQPARGAMMLSTDADSILENLRQEIDASQQQQQDTKLASLMAAPHRSANAALAAAAGLPGGAGASAGLHRRISMNAPGPLGTASATPLSGYPPSAGSAHPPAAGHGLPHLVTGALTAAAAAGGGAGAESPGVAPSGLVNPLYLAPAAITTQRAGEDGASGGGGSGGSGLVSPAATVTSPYSPDLPTAVRTHMAYHPHSEPPSPISPVEARGGDWHALVGAATGAGGDSAAAPGAAAPTAMALSLRKERALSCAPRAEKYPAGVVCFTDDEAALFELNAHWASEASTDPVYDTLRKALIVALSDQPDYPLVMPMELTALLCDESASK
ncbi:hypothetical protein CXG81DRAFT_27543 [Caulochytrium protostelioides]|uniref:Uncharacterized protein n=1 Tax=Caulochytrium protostelioides TaxID=1555241 RepID=A0A4P9X3V9_9FUNG|nr:hypothetical protein CXG81DRAFT_27543 [Caulochytrium protostelioides]|eukprot:RKO99722.1 hypothetical protein CXG81DRAFT_27543 [Caulochytrium protostelioides]